MSKKYTNHVYKSNIGFTMKKNILLTILFVFSVVCPIRSVYATDKFSSVSQAENVNVILVNQQTGERINVPVVDHTAKSLTSSETSGAHSSSYEAVITKGMLTLASSHYDTTAAIKITLTQYYQEHVVGNRSVAVSKYTALWKKYDNTVTVKNSTLKAGVLGPSEGGTLYSTTKTKNIGTPTLNSTYTLTPAWAGVYIYMNDANFQSGSAYSELVHGGSSWTLLFCVGQGDGVDCD
jgi:hypothetical protein